MSRTIPAGLVTAFAAGESDVARCLRLDLVDGTSIGLTSRDIDLAINIGDGSISYLSDTGIVPSAVSLSLGFDADNFEVSGPIGSVITKPAVLGGRFRGARARLFDVNCSNLTQYIPIIGGKVTNPVVKGGQFVFEIRSNVAAYNETIGRVLSPYCDADFGDARCGATPQTWDAIFSAAPDELTLIVLFTGTPPTAAEARAGQVSFTSGALLGCLPVEIFDIIPSVAFPGLSEISLYLPLVETPTFGDTLTATEGCDKLRATCVLKQGDATNFRGFPDLSGNDAYVQFPTPSSDS